jgi:hypothetical protein
MVPTFPGFGSSAFGSRVATQKHKFTILVEAFSLAFIVMIQGMCGAEFPASLLSLLELQPYKTSRSFIYGCLLGHALGSG